MPVHPDGLGNHGVGPAAGHVCPMPEDEELVADLSLHEPFAHVPVAAEDALQHGLDLLLLGGWDPHLILDEAPLHGVEWLEEVAGVIGGGQQVAQE